MLDTTYHKRQMETDLRDEEFREEFERAKRELSQIDGVIRSLDHLREEAGLSKAALARLIDKNEASVRRLFTAEVNPEFKTVAALAEALDAEIRVIPRKRRRQRVANSRRVPTSA